ncbi:short-chain dehydrogenase [Balneola sp. EhC07]|uniref:SDR family oxidoreductase n=1 Tax=Balneola sp. EhC07 TaxID=1849360 RepID=UPI0007F55F91|nr:SDR family oxidoreductase [Balneola sp. EhC07]OAN61803.1 short-chain dehydrogenase [Balneola sp. EhC07]
MTSFSGKSILITGAASGIGFIMGRMALEKGAKHLVMWDINSESLSASANELTSKGYSVSTNLVDVRNKEQVSKVSEVVIKEQGTIDILFNNAGIVVGKSFEDHSYKDIENTLAVNSLGLMYVARAFLPAMIENGFGRIINIASAAGLTPNPGMTVYAASKWAAVGWSDSLRIELEQNHENIKVLTVMPSYINTGMFDGVKAPLLIPLLDPEKISAKILNSVEKEKFILREPFMIKLSPFVRGILPARIYDFIAGKILKVYSSMNTFTGRKGAKDD